MCASMVDSSSGETHQDSSPNARIAQLAGKVAPTVVIEVGPAMSATKLICWKAPLTNHVCDVKNSCSIASSASISKPALYKSLREICSALTQALSLTITKAKVGWNYLEVNSSQKLLS